MIGNFHIICNFISTIGKIFGDAGLRDIAVESGVIAEGSNNTVLEGKQYNRAVRFHMLMYEALMRLSWKEFKKWTKMNHICEASNLDEVIVLSELHHNLSHSTFDAALGDDSCNIMDRYLEFLDILRHDHGDLSTFWMTYIDMIETLLGLLRSDIEGDFYLQLYCIRVLISWCFAMDKIKYAKYLQVYYAQMKKLQETSPQLFEHFVRRILSSTTTNKPIWPNCS